MTGLYPINLRKKDFSFNRAQVEVAFDLAEGKVAVGHGDDRGRRYRFVNDLSSTRRFQNTRKVSPSVLSPRRSKAG